MESIANILKHTRNENCMFVDEKKVTDVSQVSNLDNSELDSTGNVSSVVFPTSEEIAATPENYASSDIWLPSSYPDTDGLNVEQQCQDMPQLQQLFPYVPSVLPCFIPLCQPGEPLVTLNLESSISSQETIIPAVTQKNSPLKNLVTLQDDNTDADIFPVQSIEPDFLTNLKNFQDLAGQYLILQTQQFIAQQLTEFDDADDTGPQFPANIVNADDKSEAEPRTDKRLKDVYVCSIDSCHKEFGSLNAVQSHQSNHGKIAAAYHCTENGCNRVFTTSGNLKYHVLTHTNEKNFACRTEGCSEQFYTRQQLDVHTRSHTQLRPFVCDVEGCASAFSTAGNLRNHQRIHTGDKPFVCEDCGQRFTEKNSLKKHSVKHSGVRPYSCDVCGRFFTQSSSRLHHMRTKHGT